MWIWVRGWSLQGFGGAWKSANAISEDGCTCFSLLFSCIYIYIYTNIYATRTSARTDTVEDGRTQSAYRCPFHAPGFTVSAQENASVHLRGADMISDSISGVWGGGGGGGKSSNFDPARLRCNTQKSAEGQEVQLQGAFCGLRHFGDGLESAREVFAASSDIKTRGVRTLGKVPAALPEVFVWSWANQ